jgi:hypothetical protein
MTSFFCADVLQTMKEFMENIEVKDDNAIAATGMINSFFWILL